MEEPDEFAAVGIAETQRYAYTKGVAGSGKAFLAEMIALIPSIYLSLFPGISIQVFSCDGISSYSAYFVLRDFFGRPSMANKLYVGNLSYETTDNDLQRLFSSHGVVHSAQVIMDRDTGRSKGFGFVEMNTGSEAQAAITALNGQESNGRSLTVNEARPREDRAGSRGSANVNSNGDSAGRRRF